MTKQSWRVLGCIAGVGAIAALAILAQACGGGSASEQASPTATNPPAGTAGTGTPPADFTPGPGQRGQGLFFGGTNEELAAFLGISLDQLQSELAAEGATPASVAEAHGKTRDELKTFYTEQRETQLSEAVAAGQMSQENADQMLEDFASRVDGIIDGKTAAGGGPGQAQFFVGGASEELAAFLGISFDQLQSELGAEGATPASVAESHGRTRDDLKALFTKQQEAQVADAVAAGTMSQEQADQSLEDFASRVDDIIDGRMPVGRGPGAGGFVVGGQGMSIAGPSEEFAQFLGISLDQLTSELSAEGATPASVAEAHGRTRDELKAFLTEQMQAQLLEQVAAGTISVEEADSMTERFAGMIDDIIDGKVPSGGPELAPPPSAPQ